MQSELDELKETLRYSRGEKLYHSGAVRKARVTKSITLWKVKSQSDKNIVYNVIDKGKDYYECDCPDFERHRMICKHVYAVILKEVLG